MSARFDPRAAWAALTPDQQQAIGEACLLREVAIEAQRLVDARYNERSRRPQRFSPKDIAAACRWEHAEEEASRLLQETVPLEVDPLDVPDLAALGIRACRQCGCTDESGCTDEGCWWVEPDLCSACAPKAR